MLLLYSSVTPHPSPLHMPRALLKRFPLRLRLLALLPIALLLTACAESATSPDQITEDLPPTSYTQKLECTAHVQEGSVACYSMSGVSGSSPSGVKTSEHLRPIILGGQGTFVKLTSSNVGYNAGNQQFSFDVTVQNLIEQSLGTTAANVQHPDGVRVFFSQTPTATSLTDPFGSSAISISNADGTSTFTGSNQLYYQYDQVLAEGDQTAPKMWTFTVDPNVQTFSFMVYVSASVQYPTGYLTNIPYVLTLDPGEVFLFEPVVKSAGGTVLSGEVVTYNNSSPGLVSVAADGTLTAGPAHGLGSGSISLSSGTRPGIHATSVSVCQSIVVVNGTNLPSSISESDCFSSLGSSSGLPSTSYYADLYRVSLTAGQTITVEMDSDDDLDTYLLMANRFGVLVAGNDDDDAGILGVGSRMVYTATEAGVYIIEASTFNGRDTGDYTLRVTID